MPNQTPNLGLNLFLENDVFDYEEINENTSIIDSLPLPYLMGTMDSSYSYSNYSGSSKTGSTTWQYKRYSNKHIELNTAFALSDLGYASGSSTTYYYSPQVTVAMPTTLSSVYKISIKVAANNSVSGYQYHIWSTMEANSLSDLKNDIRFRVMSDKSLSSGNATTICIEVKGVEP